MNISLNLLSLNTLLLWRALELSIALFNFSYEVKSYDLCVCVANLLKQQQQLQTHIKNKRPPVKNVATQKETSSSGPENRSKIVLLVDASQQTGRVFFLCSVCTK